MRIKRFFKHIFCGPWRVRLAFPKRSLKAIEAAISGSERSHLGELRFVVEHALDLGELWRDVTPRQRAIEVFSRCRVWDTEQNSGVLIYLLLADRQVEIVADRGIHARVGDAVWGDICRGMETRFRGGEFELGVVEGIAAITSLLQRHFPAGDTENPNEMTDAPVVL
ncbi:MAG: TPM domain-containing protein [Methylococcaceae bacterium]|nr:TPM domain-containing protein [Methylococcaceae bacterium]